MKKIMNKAYIIRTSDHPVVKHYMDVLKLGISLVCPETEDVSQQYHFDKKKDFVVCDSPLISIHYYLRGFKKIITWYQGVSPEESYMNNHSKLRFWVLSWIEKIMLKHSQMNVLISQQMQSFYEQKYHLKISNAFLMPCYNSFYLDETVFRNQNKFSTPSFVYVGGMQKWQCVEDIVKLYAAIEAQLPDAKLYIYTKDEQAANVYMQQYHVKNYEIQFVQPDQLDDALKDKKYGFVLREDIPINQVATPTKLSNYTANGLIPIYSGCLDSFARIGAELGIGICVDKNNIDMSRLIDEINAPISLTTVSEKYKKLFQTYYNDGYYIELLANLLHRNNE